MGWLKGNARKWVVYLIHPLAFSMMVFSVWIFAVKIPYFSYLLWLASWEGARQIAHPSIYYSSYFIGVLRLAFLSSVSAQSLLIIKKYLWLARGRIIPPYRSKSKPDPSLPITWSESHYNTQKKLQIAGIIFLGCSILMGAVVFLYMKFQWTHTDLVANLIRKIPSDLVLASAGFLFSIPGSIYTSQFGGEMNNPTLFATFLFLWLPFVPLALGFWNLNSYLYDKFIGVLYWYVEIFDSQLSQ